MGFKAKNPGHRAATNLTHHYSLMLLQTCEYSKDLSSSTHPNEPVRSNRNLKSNLLIVQLVVIGDVKCCITVCVFISLDMFFVLTVKMVYVYVMMKDSFTVVALLILHFTRSKHTL